MCSTLLLLSKERARRQQLREERAKFIADGKDIPPELLYVNTHDKKKEESRFVCSFFGGELFFAGIIFLSTKSEKISHRQKLSTSQ